MRKLTDLVRWGGKRLHDGFIQFKQTILGLGGLGSINTAIYLNSLTWGLITTGVSLLLLQYLTEGSKR